jgi:PAS domain S-box-containing protein
MLQSHTVLHHFGFWLIIGSACSVLFYLLFNNRKVRYQLKSSEDDYRLLIEQMTDLIVKVNDRGCFLFVNPSFAAFVGQLPAQLIGQLFIAFIHEDDHDALMQALSRLESHSDRSAVELRLLTTKGWRWFQWLYHQVPQSYRKNGFIGVGRDITERRYIDAELRQYKSILMAISNPVALINRQYIYCFVNRAYGQLLNRAPEILIGHCVIEMIGTEVFNSLIREPLERCFHGQTSSCQNWWRCSSGQLSYMTATYTPYHDSRLNIVGAVVTMRDITALKQAKDMADVAATKYRTLFNSFPQGIMVTDASGTIVETNPIADRLMDLSATDHQRRRIDDPDWQFFDQSQRPLQPDDYPTVCALREQLTHSNTVIGRVNKAQQVTWFNITIAPLPITRYGLVIVIEDITASRLAQAAHQELIAIRESERRFQIMADGVPMAIWVTDAEGQLEFVNQGYAAFFGLSATQRTDQDRLNWQQFIHRDDIVHYTATFNHCLQQGLPFEIECRVRRHDGQWRWIRNAGRPRFSTTDASAGFVGAIQDITEYKQAERALRESRDRLEQRANQLAYLASQLTLAEQRERQRFARLLHDHLQQNLIAAQLGLEKFLRRQQQIRIQDIENMLTLINDAIRMARTLNADLSPPLMRESCFREALTWLVRGFAKNHGLIVETHFYCDIVIEREDLRIVVFESLREILFNIVKHAQVNKADLTVSRQGDDYILVTVRDDGIGFDLVQHHELDYSGFGLLAVRERIGFLGGELSIRSASHAGTEARLKIPLCAQSPVLPAMKSVHQQAAISYEQKPLRSHITVPQRGQTAPYRILLVDDHVLVRQGLAALLAEEDDVKVVGEASDGLEAIEMVQRIQPDLILMDASMPDLDGASAIRIIHERWPDIRIIALSMHDEEHISNDMLHAGAECYVTKTEVSEALLEKIRG